MVPAGRSETQQIPVEQHGAIGSHQHVAGMHVAVADHGLVRHVPSRVAFDRCDKAITGRVVERWSGAFQERVEVPPRECGRRGKGNRSRNCTRIGLVHLAHDGADTTPVDRRPGVVDALPCRHAQAVGDHDVVPDRFRDRHAPATPEVREFQRDVGICVRGAHAQHDGTGREDRVHPGAVQMRRFQPPCLGGGRRCPCRRCQVADRLIDVRPTWPSHAGVSTSRPGLSRPVGSNSILIRSWSARTAGSTVEGA